MVLSADCDSSEGVKNYIICKDHQQYLFLFSEYAEKSAESLNTEP